MDGQEFCNLDADPVENNDDNNKSENEDDDDNNDKSNNVNSGVDEVKNLNEASINVTSV